MTEAGPTNPSYAETFARLAQLISQEEVERGKIADMSESSLREWLNGFMMQAATTLGIAAAEVAAMIGDYVQIGRNALSTARSEYRKHYEAARRIGPT